VAIGISNLKLKEYFRVFLISAVKTLCVENLEKKISFKDKDYGAED